MVANRAQNLSRPSMSVVTGEFSLECSKCGTQHDFAPDDADFESGGSERSMGPENSYVWEQEIECDGTFEGEECGNEISISYEIYEYPVGALNMDEVTITGGTELSRFGYQFHDEPDLEEEEPDSDED